MTDNIKPLLIPSKQSRPDLEALKRLDLSSEAALYTAQHDPELIVALHQLFADLTNPTTAEQGYMVTSGNVKISEVGAIGFVDIEVAVHEAVAHFDYGRLENGRRGQSLRGRWFNPKVGQEGKEHS